MNTETHVIRATVKGETWYLQTSGDRIDCKETATRFNLETATNFAELFSAIWRVKCEVEPIDD